MTPYTSTGRPSFCPVSKWRNAGEAWSMTSAGHSGTVPSGAAQAGRKDGKTLGRGRPDCITPPACMVRQ